MYIPTTRTKKEKKKEKRKKGLSEEESKNGFKREMRTL